MIKAFVRRPATTIVAVSFFIVLGVISYFNLFIELTPKIDFPIVTITAEYPGATPFEIESQIIKKIEDRVAELSDIKRLMSRSYENYGYVFIEFNLGVDANIKAVEAKDKVEKILNDLPENSKRPLVEKFDPLAMPVVELVLSSDKYDGRELYEFADKKLKNRFSVIEGLATVDLYGGKKRQINVELDPNLAKRYFISITDVIDAIARKNLNLPGGVIDKEKNSISVRYVGEFDNIDEIRDMKLVTQESVRIKLKDIAKIYDGSKKVETVSRYKGKETVGLSLMKVSDGNAVHVGKQLKQMLPEIRKFLPEGMSLEIATDWTDYIVRETKSTVQNIYIGILLTIIILYLFTGRFKITLISAIVIPTSLISAIFLMDKSGFTINMITLLAIATSLGTLIANAIVIIESVLVHLDKGKSPVDAAIDGTKEVTVAVLASAGTNLVVFTPIAFMGGIVGQFMRQFGLTVVYATIFSIIASFTLTPMLCALILKGKDSNSNNVKKRPNIFIRSANHTMQLMLKEYRHIFDFIFRRPKTAVILNITILFVSILIGRYLGNEFMPVADEDRVTVKIVMPLGSTIDKTLDVVKEIENFIKDIPEVDSYLSNLGDNGVENAYIILNLKPAATRERSDMDIINELIPKLARIPEADIDFARGHEIGGFEGDLSINVYGDDYDEIVAYSKRVMEIMTNTGNFRSLKSSYKTPKDELRFRPDQDSATYYGIPQSVIARTVRSSIYGDDTNIYKEKGEEYKINVEMSKAYKTRFSDLDQVDIIAKKGLLPITALGKIEKDKSYPSIWRRDKVRVIQIDGYLSKSSAGLVRRDLDRAFKEKIKFKPGYGYKYVGTSEYQDESEREIGKAFLIATILTYMLLVAMLNSFLHPFTISTTIITSFSGVILFMFFMNSSINTISMLAMVMLVGIVVNNAILMLDVAMRKVKEGVPIIDALWIGVEEKFRAIFMTSIAIIFGVLPQLWSIDAAKSSMGAVMVGGIIGSIIFTFILIPPVFWYLERLKNYFSDKIVELKKPRV